MRRTAQALIGIATILVMISSSPSATNAEVAANESVFRNVHVITMDEGETLEGSVVLVRKGVVAQIGPESSLSPTDEPRDVIDGIGGYLVPGYVDAHIHYRHADELLNYLAYGVTTIVGLGQQSFEESAELLRLRDAISRGERIGPQIYTTAVIVASEIDIQTPEAAKQYVDRLANEGYDLVKIYNETPKAVFDAIVEESLAQHLSVFGHIPRNFPSSYSLANGLDVITHAEELYFTFFEGFRDQDLDRLEASNLPDLDRTPELANLLLQNDVALIPGLGGGFAQMVFWDDDEAVFADPELKYLHPRISSLWRRMNVLQREPLDKRMLRERIKYSFTHEITRRLFEAGVLLVTGTDAAVPNQPPGKSLHRELRELVKTGLSYEEALATTTRDAGRFLRKYVDEDARVGVIRVGYEADMVLLAENPLENIRHAASIMGVMSDGRWFPRGELTKLREERAERYARLREMAVAIEAAVRTKASSQEILGSFDRFQLNDDDARDYIRSLVEGIGYEAFAGGDLGEVLRVIQLNTQIFPGSANAWDTLGEVYSHLKRPEDALSCYRRALEVDPTFEHASREIERIEKDQREP